MKKNATRILLLLLLLPTLMLAQRQYFDATLTTNDGKTLAGKIAVGNWLVTPRSLDFQEENGSFRRYSVNEVSQFDVVRHDGFKLHFVRHECDVEISPVQLKSLDTHQDLKFRRDTSWHQLVYEGTWSLYSMMDRDNKSHFFIKTENMPATELVYKPWLREHAIGLRVEGAEMYKKLLYDLAEGCPEALKLITGKALVTGNKLRLQQKGLEAIFAAYDKCQGKSATYRLKDEKGLWAGRIVAGRHIGSINFNPDANVYTGNIQSFHAGVSFDYFFPKSNKRVSIFNEVVCHYDSKKDSTYHKDFFVTSGYLDYHAWHIAVSTMGAVRFTKSQFSPTLKFGLINRFQVGQKATFTDDDYLGLIVSDFSKYRNSYEIGPAIGISGEYHRFGLDIRYSNSNALYWRDFWNEANTQMLSVSATFRFL